MANNYSPNKLFHKWSVILFIIAKYRHFITHVMDKDTLDWNQLSFSLSVCPPVSLSLSPSVCLSVFICLSLSLALSVSVLYGKCHKISNTGYLP